MKSALVTCIKALPSKTIWALQSVCLLRTRPTAGWDYQQLRRSAQTTDSWLQFRSANNDDCSISVDTSSHNIHFTNELHYAATRCHALGQIRLRHLWWTPPTKTVHWKRVNFSMWSGNLYLNSVVIGSLTHYSLVKDIHRLLRFVLAPTQSSMCACACCAKQQHP